MLTTRHTRKRGTYQEIPSARNKHCMHDVQVRCERFVRKTGKGGATYFHSYEGTFITSDGALFVLPPTGGRSMAPATGRKIEKRMLSVLFANNVNPKANPAVARRCETPKGLRSEFLRMVKTVPARPVSETRSNPEQNAANRRFDCLLLMKVFSDRTVSTSKVGINFYLESTNTVGGWKLIG